jgi:hypothetical protein
VGFQPLITWGGLIRAYKQWLGLQYPLTTRSETMYTNPISRAMILWTSQIPETRVESRFLRPLIILLCTVGWCPGSKLVTCCYIVRTTCLVQWQQMCFFGFLSKHKEDHLSRFKVVLLCSSDMFLQKFEKKN